MLVTPDDQVNKGRDLTVHDTLLRVLTDEHALVGVLMYNQNVEPLGRVLPGSLKLNILLLKGQIKSFIAHPADPENRQLSRAFFQKNGLHLYLFDICYFSEIVYVVVCADLVKCPCHFQPNW